MIIKNLNSKIIFDDFAKQTIGTRSIIEISSKMIRQQGTAVKNFYGTCGLCSIVNATIPFGNNLTEKRLIKIGYDILPL